MRIYLDATSQELFKYFYGTPYMFQKLDDRQDKRFVRMKGSATARRRAESRDDQNSQQLHCMGSIISEMVE
ncbi:predicted protein [Coccidioides posadasii str. Silveira]|uniref:Predicted protein n=1 Tax=Coccidioides posadasii (strain RMSCC 757 / Silveira) TaxID=443226 RepID=E9D436_COCPS|nr:predicted protein [Coccidioides posadasii str. Silveira]